MDQAPPTPFAAWLRALMATRGDTPVTFAVAAGFTASAVRQWQAGALPGGDGVTRLLHADGLDLSAPIRSAGLVAWSDSCAARALQGTGVRRGDP